MFPSQPYSAIQSSPDLIVDDKSLHIALIQIAEITITFSVVLYIHVSRSTRNGFGWRYIWGGKGWEWGLLLVSST